MFVAYDIVYRLVLVFLLSWNSSLFVCILTDFSVNYCQNPAIKITEKQGTIININQEIVQLIGIVITNISE